MNIEKFTEPITKLIEVISNSIGVIYEPRRIEQKAKAEAKATIYQKIGELVAKELDERALMRFIAKENKRQINIDNIVKYAITEMSIKEKVTSEEKPDPDWITNFFNLCQDISNDELQILWGKLLANEVDKPGSFRRRTMHTLKMISPIEAKWFNTLCTNLIIITDEIESKEEYYSMITQFIPIKKGIAALDFSGISSYEMYRLEEIGLLNVTDYDFKESDGYFLNINGELYKSIQGVDYYLPTYTLTLIGENIFSAINVDSNSEYLRICKDFLLEREFIKRV